MSRGHVQSIDVARAITAHALGVREAVPPTLGETRWHNDQLDARAVQLNDAYQCVSKRHIEARELWRQRNHWRLAAVIGWSLALLLIALGGGR